MIARAGPWATHCFKGHILSLVLLLIVFGGLVYGLSAAVQGITPGLLWPLALIGLLLGWLLACSSGWRRKG